jgi:lipopolysaccharide export system permease protein
VAQLISNLLQTKDTAEALYNYIFLVPWLLNKILAVCCLFASLFSLNKLINRNELVAIFASGFTRKKFLITIFQASMVVALFQFMVNGFLGPKAAYEKKIKEATKTKLFKGKELRQTFLKKGKFWHKGEDYFLSFGIFDPSKSDVLQNIYLLKFNKNFAITKGIFAKKAHYHKDKTWIFLNAKVISNLNQNDFPEVEERASMEVLLAETPEDFNQLRSFIPTLNFFELKNYIDRMKKVDINTAEFEVIYLDMLATTVICIIFALLASLPIFFPNRRGNPFGKNLISILVFTLIYWFFYSYCLELGKSSKVNVYLATFMVPGFFLLLLGGYFYRHRKLA